MRERLERSRDERLQQERLLEEQRQRRQDDERRRQQLLQQQSEDKRRQDERLESQRHGVERPPAEKPSERSEPVVPAAAPTPMAKARDVAIQLILAGERRAALKVIEEALANASGEDKATLQQMRQELQKSSAR